MNTPPAKSADDRPALVLAVVGLIVIQTIRVAALGVAQDGVADSTGQAWFFPALADVAFGITAPIVGLALVQLTGIGVWVGGIVWLSLSLFDFIDGLATNLAIGPPPGLGASASDATGVLLAWIAVDIAALVLLSRAVARSHYLRT